MSETEQLFHTSDLNPTDKLYKNKKDAIQDLEKLFTRDLNSKSRMTEDDLKADFWRDRRFYMQPVHFDSSHLVYALENKKAFIK